MSGSAASLEGAGAAAVGLRHLSPSLVPRLGPAAPPRAEAGSWSIESSRGVTTTTLIPFWSKF